MMTRLARAIIRRYPFAWRERYEGEVLSLLDDSPVAPVDVLELSRGLIVERAKALIEPADHPALTDWGFRTVAGLINIAPAVTIVVGGAALGGQLARWLGDPPQAVPLIAVACCLVVLVIDIGARRVKGVALPRSINLALGVRHCLFMVMWHWSWTPSASVPANVHKMFYWSQLWVWTTVAHRLLGWRFPWRPMCDAVEKYQEALLAVRDAQSDVDRCRASNERLAQFHLQPALETLTQRERERDEARAIVETYGYRARFWQTS